MSLSNLKPEASMIRSRTEIGLEATAGESPLTMIKAEGQTASEAFTEGQFVQLGLHLNNSNGKNFAIAYRKEGRAKYTKSKAKTEETALKRAYDSTKEAAWKPMAFAPYSTNRNGMSRWGALDFDGHDGGLDEDRARKWAFRCWQSLLNQAPCVICEHSGRGWHVWLVWREFKAANWINHLLRSTASEVGCEIESGKCEIFPEAAPSGLGKPMRMPGTYNASTGRCSIILSENIQASEVLDSLYVRFDPFSRTNLTDTEKNTLCKVPIYRQWAEVWQEQYSIKIPRTRNDLLTKLVYEIFNQVGLEQAETMAGLQFDQKQVTTVEDRMGHMSEFKAAWLGLENRFVQSLSARERCFYESLKRQAQKDKFRIVRSWARLSAENGHSVFPLAIRSLADRVGQKVPTASEFRNLLVQHGIIREVEGYQAGVKCGRYAWQAGEVNP
jgi:hypothetical protein